MTIQVDTIISARWIIPIEPRNTVLENTCIAIKDGKIIDIYPQSETNKYSANDIIELPHHVLMPGLINCHTHSPMVLLRSLADDMPLMDWLNNYIWPAETKWMSPEFINDGTELAFAEMIKGGTTCFNEHYFYPDVFAKVAVKTGMRGGVGMWVMDNQNPMQLDADTLLEKGENAYQKYKNEPLLTFTYAPHAPYTLTDQTLLRLKALSEEKNIPIYMHVHETQDEIDMGIKEYGMRPLARLKKLGLLNPTFQAVHMACTNDEDIKILKETGTQVIHCPDSNYKLNSGICPVQKMLDNGINVAFGTDSACSNNNLDMIEEMRTCAISAKVLSNNIKAVSAMTALEMLTINGAKLMGLDKEIGSIVKGKAADLIAFDMYHPATLPIHNPISQIAYAVNSMQTTDVWVNGKQLLKDGKLTTLNEDKIKTKAIEWGEKIYRSQKN